MFKKLKELFKPTEVFEDTYSDKRRQPWSEERKAQQSAAMKKNWAKRKANKEA